MEGKEHMGIHEAVASSNAAADEGVADRLKSGNGFQSGLSGRCLKVVPKQEFDGIAAEFDDVSIDQIAAYKESQIPGQTQLVIACLGDKIIGGAVVVLYTVPYFGNGIANIRFGPFWQRRNQETDPENYRLVLELLKEEFADRQGHMIRILPAAHPNCTRGELAALKASGFGPDPSGTASNRFFVNLGLSEAQQLASLSQKWRYNLRKSLKRGIEFAEDNTPQGHQRFEQVHSEMLNRKKVTLTDDLSHVPVLRRELPKRLKPRTFLVSKDNKPLAGATIMPLGKSAMYWYGATSDEGLSMGAGYVLHWNIMQVLKTSGHHYYDLGGSSRISGLQQFKKGLVGRGGWEIGMQPEYFYTGDLRGTIFGESIQILRRAKAQVTYLRNR